MLIPSVRGMRIRLVTSLSRRVNANSQHDGRGNNPHAKLIKKGEC